MLIKISFKQNLETQIKFLSRYGQLMKKNIKKAEYEQKF